MVAVAVAVAVGVAVSVLVAVAVAVAVAVRVAVAVAVAVRVAVTATAGVLVAVAVAVTVGVAVSVLVAVALAVGLCRFQFLDFPLSATIANFLPLVASLMTPIVPFSLLTGPFGMNSTSTVEGCSALPPFTLPGIVAVPPPDLMT